jgi:hypothetical protein
VRDCEVNREAHHCDRLEGKPAQTKPAHFKKTRERFGRTNEQSPMMHLEMDAVVAHQARDRNRLQQRERESRFAGPGRPPDKHRPRPDQYG